MAPSDIQMKVGKTAMTLTILNKPSENLDIHLIQPLIYLIEYPWDKNSISQQIHNNQLMLAF